MTFNSDATESIILVVDDEARMRKLVRDFLTKSGFAVIEAADGNEAMDIFFRGYTFSNHQNRWLS